MSITTNKCFNKIIIGLGNISGGYIKEWAISFLYFYYRKFPPKHVRNAKNFYLKHKEELDVVQNMLEDALSKEIYTKIIHFRSSYDMRIHPGYTLDDIYFVNGIISVSDNEVFVDCGAYEGDSIEKFLRQVNNFDKIIAFEPDYINFTKLLSNFGQEAEKVICINGGVWNEKKTLFFKADGNEVSKIVEEQDVDNLVRINVEKIDDIAECRDATYIKMDIEGSEMAALEGAKDTIIRNRPKLAISIYHKDEDLIKIPLYIHSLVPDYKMYIRHHSHSYFDTVLYCI